MSPVNLAGRYELLEKLDQGAYGITYLATDHQSPSKPKCVVKALYHKESKILDLFKKEAIALEKLGKHSHIPQLLAYFDEGDQFYIVQEWVEGHNLSHEISPGKKLSEGYVVKLLKDILSVLAFVHQNRVIHRDIKPANLVRQKRNGDIFLIDFGVVKELSGSQLDGKGKLMTTVAVGTAGYMAPEQERGKPCLASDLYAVGMVAIAALTGRPPKHLERHPLTGKVSWQQDSISISPALGTFINRLVEPHPKRRYRSAKQALTALEQTVAGIQIGNNSRYPTRAVAKGKAIAETDDRTDYTVVKTLFPMSNRRAVGIVAFSTVALLVFGGGVKSYQFIYDWVRDRIEARNQLPPGLPEAQARELVALLEDGSIQSQPVVVNAFWAMAVAAKEDGISLYPLAAYISKDQQRQQLQSRVTDQDANARSLQIEKWIRQSDYHTGYAVAIADYRAERSTDWDRSFEKTKAYRWLKRNAKDYGFVLSYPRGNPAGEKEPWHWRYDGAS